MAQRVASLYAEISADTSKLDKGLKGAKSQLASFSKQMESAAAISKQKFEAQQQAANQWKNDLKDLGKNALVVAGALGTLGAAAKIAFEWGAEGASIQRTEQGLAALSGSSLQAEAAIIAVSRAAGGAVTSFEAAQNASRLFSMGLAETVDEAAQLTEMAVTLGAAMGKGPSQAMEDFSLMLANNSIPRLDTFGISAAQARERINELTASGMDMSKAFQMAVLEIGSEKLDQLTEAGFEAATSFEQLTAATSNYFNNIKKNIASGLDPLITRMADMAARQVAFQEAQQSGLVVMDHVNKQIELYSGKVLTAAEAEQWLANVMDARVRTAEAAADMAGKSAMELINMDRAIRGLDPLPIEEVSDTLEDAASAAEEAAKAADNFWSSLTDPAGQLDTIFEKIDLAQWFDPAAFAEVQDQIQAAVAGGDTSAATELAENYKASITDSFAGFQLDLVGEGTVSELEATNAIAEEFGLSIEEARGELEQAQERATNLTNAMYAATDAAKGAGGSLEEFLLPALAQGAGDASAIAGLESLDGKEIEFTVNVAGNWGAMQSASRAARMTQGGATRGVSQGGYQPGLASGGHLGGNAGDLVALGEQGEEWAYQYAPGKWYIYNNQDITAMKAMGIRPGRGLVTAGPLDGGGDGSTLPPPTEPPLPSEMPPGTPGNPGPASGGGGSRSRGGSSSSTTRAAIAQAETVAAVTELVKGSSAIASAGITQNAQAINNLEQTMANMEATLSSGLERLIRKTVDKGDMTGAFTDGWNAVQ